MWKWLGKSSTNTNPAIQTNILWSIRVLKLCHGLHEHGHEPDLQQGPDHTGYCWAVWVQEGYEVEYRGTRVSGIDYRCYRFNSWPTKCQVYLDVDCSKFTYETQPSTLIQNAVEKAQREMEEMPMIGEGMMLNRTETQEEVLSKSLLKHIDEKTASEDDILEAYCRDVDA